MENNKSAPKCQAKHPRTSENICDRDIWDDNEKLCIFHCKEKPVEEFKKYFLAELKHVNETDSIEMFDCSCFVFPHKIVLKEISFNKAVNFKLAQFGDKTNFGGAKFGDETNFEAAQFGDETYFGHTQFGDKTNFWEAKFGDETYFGRAQFGYKTHFGRAKFGDETIFEAAQFGDETNFGFAQFGDKTHFGFAQFGDETDFWEAKFGDETYFWWEAKFGDKTDFGRAQFGDKTKFININFGYLLKLNNVCFNGEVILKDIKFKETNSNNIINFTNVTFEESKRARIENVDLKSFALVNSNIQYVNFLDCAWPKIGKRFFAVFDEIYYRDNKNKKNDYFLEKATLGEIEQLYLRLQSNFENSKRYATAGDFYIGAMEMRRKQIAQKSNKAWLLIRQNVFSLTAWYRYVSYYGEQYLRTLIWMLIVLLLFPVFYLIAGFKYPTTNSLNPQYEYVNYDLVQNFDSVQLTVAETLY